MEIAFEQQRLVLVLVFLRLSLTTNGANNLFNRHNPKEVPRHASPRPHPCPQLGPADGDSGDAHARVARLCTFLNFSI